MPTEIPTEHPHIVRYPDRFGGSPVIRGTGVSLLRFAVSWKRCANAEELAAAHPELRMNQIFDAISYYLDHQEEIERALTELRADRSLAARHGLIVDSKGFLRTAPPSSPVSVSEVQS